MTPADNPFPSTLRKPPSGSPSRIGPPSSRPSGFPSRNPPSSNCKASMPGTGRSRTPFEPQAKPPPRPKFHSPRSPRSTCRSPDVSRKQNQRFGLEKTKWCLWCEQLALCLNENKGKRESYKQKLKLTIADLFVSGCARLSY